MKTFAIDSSAIPAIGLGTWKADNRTVAGAVSTALETGYRHIDCAPIYMNEAAVGEAVKNALDKGVARRDELWVTSKLWNNAHQKKHVQPALEKTLRDLRLDYLDLYLIHWPVHFKPGVLFPKSVEDFLPPEAIPLMETWQAMEKLVEKGLVRFIGVCNFSIGRLRTLVEQGAIAPVMNQIELHPYLQQRAMLDYCRSAKILLTAYSPLGSGDRPVSMKKDDEPTLLSHPEVLETALHCGVTPGQILLAWGLARQTVVIPKSVDAGRIRENLDAASVNLDDQTLARLDALDLDYRYVDGAFFCPPGSPYSLDILWQR